MSDALSRGCQIFVSRLMIRWLTYADFMQVFPSREAFQRLEQDFSGFDAESVETCLAFLNAATDIYAAFDAHFARYGLSAGKFTVLMQLYVARQGMLPSEFAERANVTRATITGLLDGLEREGLIQRLPHPSDRRMLTVHLTDKGTQLLANILPDHFCRTKGLMADLTTKEKKTLVRLLKKLSGGALALSNSGWSDCPLT